jgi:hypothetical protein
MIADKPEATALENQVGFPFFAAFTLDPETQRNMYPNSRILDLSKWVPWEIEFMRVTCCIFGVLVLFVASLAGSVLCGFMRLVRSFDRAVAGFAWCRSEWPSE